MRNALLVSVLTLALVSPGSGQTDRLAVPPVRPRLVIIISVDQMRYDYLVRFKPLFTGGLKTLIDRGAVFSNARYRHANCETGPGHSVILSDQPQQLLSILRQYRAWLRSPLLAAQVSAKVPLQVRAVWNRHRR